MIDYIALKGKAWC